MQTKKRALILIYLLFSFSLFSQLEKSVWYFGNKAGIDFSSGAPVVINNGQTTPDSQGKAEGTAIACDSVTGALLFYTDGTTIWNKNHAVMSNGSGLKGDKTSTQSALIVPMPGNPNKYYIFTTPGECGEWDLTNSTMTGLTPSGYSVPATYSVVDMSLAGGLGAVTTKNVTLFSVADEKITAIRHCNGIDWWVIFHKYASNQFYVYLLTSAGVNATPVITSIGTATQYANTTSTLGAMKATSDGKKIAMATCQAPKTMQLFDFCRANGKLSNAMVDATFGADSNPYGIAFSPDNSKLYLTTWSGGANPNLNNSQLYQYDLSSGTQAGIVGSKTLITTAAPGGTGRLHGLCQAPNGKIYVVRESFFLDVINTPNTLGLGCGYATNSINLTPGKGIFGLPNFIECNVKAEPKPTVNLGPDIAQCSGSVVLDAGPIDAGCGTGSYSWNTGATTQTITVNTTGDYWVKVTACGSDTDTIHIDIGSIDVKLGNDTGLCTGAVILNAQVAGATYSWSTGATSQTISASTPGTYWVEVDLNGCKSQDTISITAGSISVSVSDATVCSAQYTIDAGIANSSYLWSTGATTQSITVSNSGNYWIEVTQGNCKGRDTVLVTLGSLSVNIGNDTSICTGPLTIGYPIAGATYQWNNGQTSSSINVSNSGIYWVEVSLGNCKASDTIDVQFGQLSIDLGDDVSLCASQHQLTAAGNAATYLWNTGATTQSITVSQSGTYYVNVANGACVGNDTVEVVLASAITVDVGADTIFCGDVNIQLDAGNPGSDYIWSNGATSQVVNITTPGTYMIAVSNGLCMDRDTINVLAFDPSIDLTVGSDLCDADEIILDAGNPGANYIWNTGATTQVITVQDSGYYWVDVSMGNCKAGDTVKVEGPFGEPVLFVPNAFTPNGDLKNEIFTAYASDITDFKMYLYDRWGNKFFETTNIYKGWDGKINGQFAPLDVYVWIIEYKTVCGKEKVHREIGHVSIIR